jgi:glycosyltransferase involved in cell wall biosynthesis
MVSFSVVVPTLGRGSLGYAMGSIREGGLEEGVDEVMVVMDSAGREETEEYLGKGERVVWVKGMVGRFGYPQRNAALAWARGSHLIFLDDDDYYLPGAVSAMREEVEKAPEKIHLFRMDWGRDDREHQVIWREPRLYGGNVSTPLFCIPNVPDKLGKFGERYEGDYDFLVSTLAARGETEADIVWVDRLIARVIERRG